MKITDIKIRKLFDDGPMKAIASVTLDAQLAVHDIKIINARDKFFIVMPSRKNADDTYRDIVHPINAEFRAMLEKEVIRAYNEALIEAEKKSSASVTVCWQQDCTTCWLPQFPICTVASCCTTVASPQP